MSKLSTSEHFFIEKISEGMELKGKPITIDDIQALLSNGLHCKASFKAEIIAALNAAFTDIDEENVKKLCEKLYAGRETLLRDLVIEWYKKSHAPKGWLDKLKSLFSK